MSAVEIMLPSVGSEIAVLLFIARLDHRCQHVEPIKYFRPVVVRLTFDRFVAQTALGNCRHRRGVQIEKR